MAETYPIDFPTTVPVKSLTLTGQTTVALNESPFTYTHQVLKYPGERWVGTLVFPPMNRDTAEVLNSFLLRLRGVYGKFRLEWPEYTGLRSNASYGNVFGADQTGDEIEMVFYDSDDNLLSNSTEALAVGQYIQIGSDSGSPRLHKVLESVSVNSLSRGTAKVFPEINTAPSNAETIDFTDPKGTFRLAGDASWSVDEALIYSTSIAIAEAL